MSKFMPKFLLQLLVVATLAFAAPAAQASSISLEDQRQEVYDALDVVADQLQDEINDALTLYATLSPTSFQARILRRQILILSGRLRFVEATQQKVFYFNADMLDRIIIRYDLPVSLS